MPYAPGGPTDLMARSISGRLTEALGQTVVVDNRAGAGGNVSAEIAAKSPPDGYTLLMGAISTHSINASLYSKLPFDPVKDFAPITLASIIPLVFNDLTTAIQPYKAGRIKILGVSTAKRVPQVPEVATIGESVAGYEAHTWFGVLVPAGTPQSIIDRLSRESMKILQSDEIKKRFAEVGAEPVGGTPQQFAAFMTAETAKWAKVIKASGARVD